MNRRRFVSLATSLVAAPLINPRRSLGVDLPKSKDRTSITFLEGDVIRCKMSSDGLNARHLGLDWTVHKVIGPRENPKPSFLTVWREWKTGDLCCFRKWNGEVIGDLISPENVLSCKRNGVEIL